MWLKTARDCFMVIGVRVGEKGELEIIERYRCLFTNTKNETSK